jgi:hypothetical protein
VLSTPSTAATGSRARMKNIGLRSSCSSIPGRAWKWRNPVWPATRRRSPKPPVSTAGRGGRDSGLVAAPPTAADFPRPHQERANGPPPLKPPPHPRALFSAETRPFLKPRLARNSSHSVVGPYKSLTVSFGHGVPYELSSLPDLRTAAGASRECPSPCARPCSQMAPALSTSFHDPRHGGSMIRIRRILPRAR